MAKLSAHGRAEIGRIDYMTKRRAYMSDGSVLDNCNGERWTKFGKVKKGLDPRQVYLDAVAALKRRDERLPANAALREELHAAFSLKDRHWVIRAIELMPEDPDGVWSELNDGIIRVECDLSDIVKLCGLHCAAQRELKAWNTKKAEEKKAEELKRQPELAFSIV